MSEGKWFSDLGAGTPLAEAARSVLTTRLEIVGKYLDEVAKAENGDPENIHQLRVSSRRATAGLELLVDCFPSKIQTKAKKELKRLRRAAGGARDWDVFLHSLKMRSVPRPMRSALDLVIGYALAQHESAKAQLQAEAQEYSQDFSEFCKGVITAIGQREHQVRLQTLSSLPVTAIFSLVRGLDEAAGQDLTDADNLHKVRIAGKKLRYAMEILAGCFLPEFREKLYPAVEIMQEILGRANDCRFAISRLEGLRDQINQSRPSNWKSLHKALGQLIVDRQTRLTRERRAFERWYRNWKKSGGEPAFAALLQNQIVGQSA
jgi:CHAD domain-containing protein